ncbi:MULTISPECIES: YicC/YloC family endoribonuclease [unclassified Hyphomonas]|uniref:YicC/YloC family endoribonuclease n=1 Tax=unclassified Hyphomonas TaxID=2630699 RepID=UPI0005536D72|nr:MULTISPECIES: YicC/YloC family endoribonuclease [unclassified Hyphomonas]
MSVLSGMTGFARVAGEAEWGSWAWEAKSVNGRGLDVRVNYPPGMEALERAVKSAATKFFKRGSLQVALRIELASGADTTTINNALLDALAAAVEKRTGTALSGDVFASLMNVKGVVEPGASNLRDLAGDDAVIKLLASAGEDALQALQVERQREGGVLSELLEGLVAGMEAHWREAGELAASQPALLKERLTKQLDELDPGGRVDKDRMAAEIALSAAKADVREELDRLSAHFASARELLAGGSPVGRKLDFLAQELNREANTLCSKSISLDLTNAGLGLKGLIDQFKEQAANVE